MVRKARSARQIYLVQSALGPEADATNGSNWPKAACGGSPQSAKSGHQGWLESGPKDYALSPIIAGQTVTTILPIC